VCAAERRSLDFGHDVYAIVLVSVSIDPDLHLPRSSQDLSVTIVKVYFYKIHFSEDKQKALQCRAPKVWLKTMWSRDESTTFAFK
jgi:hypothetical protein